MSQLLSILRGQAPRPVGVMPLGQPEQRAASRPVSFIAGSGGRTRQVVQLDPRARDYSASAVAYRCVQGFADQASTVDLQVVRDAGADGEAVVPHPVADLWNRGTEGAPFSARYLRTVAWQQLELRGECFLYLDRGETGDAEPRGLWPIFDRVEIVASEGMAGQVAGYVVVRPNGGRVPLLASEVLWLRYPDPWDPWGCLAPWKAALYATEADAYARAWQVGELKNGARPSHVVYLGDLDEQAHTAAVLDYRQNVEGPGNSGRSLLVSGAVQARVDRIGLTPAELSYLETRTANAAEVMLAFGMPRDYLMGGATYENRAASATTLWTGRIVPALDVVGSELDRQAVADRQHSAAWDLSDVDALQDSVDALYGRVRDAAYTDVLTVDELRGTLGHGPLPGGLGAHTLTPYRLRAELAAQDDAGVLAVPDPVRAVLPRPRMLRIAGTTRTLRAVSTPPSTPVQNPVQNPMQTRKRPRGMSPKAVGRFYDRQEKQGIRAIKRLAEKQQRIVLRKLEQVRTSHIESWAEHRAHAVALPSQAPDAEWSDARLDRSALALTALPTTEPCTCTRVAADDIFDVAYHREQTREGLHAFMAGTWEGGAGALAGGLGLDLDRFELLVLVAMDARLDVLAEMVTQTTRAALDQQLLLSGVAGGESISELRARLQAVFTDLSGWRATTIARTETVGGFGAASHIVATETGLVTARVWGATDDARTRPDHVELDGERVAGATQRYSNGLLHPGEPGAPARQVINCRCYEEFEVDE